MLFTSGQDRKTERLMLQKPNFNKQGRRKPIFFPDKYHRDCPYCLYFLKRGKKCGLEKCTVFED